LTKGRTTLFRNQSIDVLLWGDPDHWNFLLICEHFEYEMNSICTSNPARSCSYANSNWILFQHRRWTVYRNNFHSLSLSCLF
jgi:hypothetical protein